MNIITITTLYLNILLLPYHDHYVYYDIMSIMIIIIIIIIIIINIINIIIIIIIIISSSSSSSIIMCCMIAIGNTLPPSPGASSALPFASPGRTPAASSGTLFTLLDLCVSSLRRGHANLLCIVPILTDDPRRESNLLGYIILRFACLLFATRVGISNASGSTHGSAEPFPTG